MSPTAPGHNTSERQAEQHRNIHRTRLLQNHVGLSALYHLRLRVSAHRDRPAAKRHQLQQDRRGGSSRPCPRQTPTPPVVPRTQSTPTEQQYRPAPLNLPNCDDTFLGPAAAVKPQSGRTHPTPNHPPRGHIHVTIAQACRKPDRRHQRKRPTWPVEHPHSLATLDRRPVSVRFGCTLDRPGLKENDPLSTGRRACDGFQTPGRVRQAHSGDSASPLLTF